MISSGSPLKHDDEMEIDLQELLGFVLSQWKKMVLGGLIGALLAFGYLKTVNPKFRVETSVLLKSVTNSIPDELSVFDDLGMVSGSASTLEDEIQLFRSRPLIKQMVEKHNLHIRYYSKNSFKNTELFLDKPFKLEWLSPINDSYTFDFALLDSENFSLSINGSEEMPLHFNKEIGYENVRFRIIPLLDINALKGQSYQIYCTPISKTVNQIINNLQINPLSDKTHGLTLTMEVEQAERGQLILEELVATYNKLEQDDKNLISENTAAFIDSRLKGITKELVMVEGHLESFKTQRVLTDLDMESGLYLRDNAQSRQEINTLSTQLELALLMKKSVLEGGIQLLPTNIGLDHSGVKETIDNFNQLILEKNQLLESASENHPTILTMNERLTELQKGIAISLEGYIGQIGQQIKGAGSFQGQTSTALRAMPKKEREYRSIQRQQHVKESLYLYLLKKREEIAISLASVAPNAKLINNPHVHESPVFPKYHLILAAGTGLGSVIPLVISFLLFFLNGKISNGQELEAMVGIPVLADIAKHKSKVKYLFGDDDFSSTAESFRLLDANLDFMLDTHPDDTCRTVLVTSSISGEGKSFVALNYARSLALAGKKVLLLDTDVRASKLMGYLGVDHEFGLSDYLRYPHISVSDIVFKAEGIPKLDVIGAGQLLKSVSDFMTNRKLRELIEQLQLDYDYLIIDTPPVATLSDTLRLKDYADICLYVVRANYVDKKLLHFPKKLFQENRFRHFALIMNDVDYTKTDYYKYGYLYTEKGEVG
ncbi:GumC family protein [Sediminicola luteus]|uniref:non-specific protein-tyrosine kinase n=1 Tax=Sediminicola luteus TaxID=319238 RepID=A0A2A4G4B1_9FLAO|nr:polysaccharide biosynthesis tyrosine autokinase [Sediminicola luteus]PCE63271.1 hypothetical protein B7P33_13680 [Sediminicola luteus]